jgi:hypothetical protein
MKKSGLLILGSAFAFTSIAMAKHDGSDIPACKGVTDVCMAADVTATDKTNGKTVKGYQPGEHKKDGEGLWVDCVAKLAHGKTVPGVSGVSQTAAQACLDAEKASHPGKKKH